MANTLAFQSTTFDIVDRNGQPWLRLPQIGAALGYARGHKVQQVYERNAAEFTESMTAVVKLPDLVPQSGVTGQMREVRIFSLRGAHLLGMFARTKVAADFRRWVLDVLDAQVQQVALLNACITPEQAGELAALIAERFPDGRDRPYAWGRFNNHFRIARYRELPAARFDEACAYIRTMQPKALPAPSLIDARQYETLNELLARLARQLAEPNGYSVITFMPLYEEICRQLGHSPRYVERLPELLTDPGFEVSDELLSQLQLAVHQRLMQKLAAAREDAEVLRTAIWRIKHPKPKALPALKGVRRALQTLPLPPEHEGAA